MFVNFNKTHKCWVIAGFLSFIIYFTIQQISHERQTGHRYGDVMPYLMKELHANITSLKYWKITSSTWQFVITYQWLWMLYSLTTLFRINSLQILPPHFYASWCLSCCFEIGYLFLAAHRQTLWAWIFTCSSGICRCGCLFFAFYSLFEFLAAHSGKHKEPNKFDVWGQRILIQNGLICYQTWSTISACFHFAPNLQRMFGISQHAAYNFSLLILAVIIVVWFVAQNFYVEKYARYTCSEYVTMVIIFGLVFSECRANVDGTYAFVLLLLCFSILLLLFRVSLIVFNERGRIYASDEELEFMV